jgi:hypothetical protein
VLEVIQSQPVQQKESMDLDSAVTRGERARGERARGERARGDRAGIDSAIFSSDNLVHGIIIPFQ